MVDKGRAKQLQPHEYNTGIFIMAYTLITTYKMFPLPILDGSYPCISYRWTPGAVSFRQISILFQSNIFTHVRYMFLDFISWKFKLRRMWK